MAGAGTTTTPAIYIARQPILDERGKLFGYELLYRGGTDETTCSIETRVASARVITSALLDVGLDTLSGGARSFLNVTGELLETIDSLAPASDVVVELLETVEVSPAVIEACRRLREKGYLLALDDFVPGSPAEVLLPYASFVKVDVLNTSIADGAALAARLRPAGVTMLAEKVENREVYQDWSSAGYRLFQGYYFCKPVIQPGVGVPAQKLVYLRLLAALSRSDLSTTELESLVKQDVSLSLRVLRFVNSAAVPTRVHISTIREALFIIGMNPIRKWASVWCLAGLNTGATSELATTALVRARACEIVGDALAGAYAPELFLVGLCSLLDAMLGRPMEEALGSLPLSEAAIGALLGEQNAARTVLDAVTFYEAGEWDKAREATERLGIRPLALSSAYTSALRWVRQVRGDFTSAA